MTNQKSLDKLLLCHSCYCMTKTIKGLCGKCGEMKSLDKKKAKELDWEKEFDKNWINPWSRNNFGIPKAHLDIKDFISRTLTQQRTELLEGIPKKIKGKNKEFVEGYNNAIDDITNLLNKKDE